MHVCSCSCTNLVFYDSVIYKYFTGCFFMSYRKTATAKKHQSVIVIMLWGSCKIQSWKSRSSTAAVPLCRPSFIHIWEGREETWRQLLLLSTHQRDFWILPSFTVNSLSSLFLRKAKAEAGTRQDECSRLTCLLSRPLTLEEPLSWVAGWHSCPKQPAMYPGAQSAFGLLGHLVPSRWRSCQGALIMHLPRLSCSLPDSDGL